MSRTFRNTPPRYTRAAFWRTRLRGIGGDSVTTMSPKPEPIAARDGKVYTGTRKECGDVRHETRRKHRAQCRQALHHGLEFPADPRTEGWLTW